VNKKVFRRKKSEFKKYLNLDLNFLKNLPITEITAAQIELNMQS